MNIFAAGWSEGFDGPGRRMVYYLKGCNFRCAWCGNPESLSPEPQMLFYPRRSVDAALCCPAGAVKGERLERDICGKCRERKCVTFWRNPAFELSGRDISISQLVQDVLERRPVFGESGGVTFSGGEPTMQEEALCDAANALRKIGVHTALETNASSPRLEKIAGFFDLVIADLKCVTPNLHRTITGADNAQTLANLAADLSHIIRIPLIQQLNCSEQEMRDMAKFLGWIGAKCVELLPLHLLGAPKYHALGEQHAAELLPPQREQAEAFAGRLRAMGIPSTVVI